jgi:hypothetical protein
MAAAPRNVAFEHRDIRSANLGFKRDRDHTEKWSNGKRPGVGLQVDPVTDEIVNLNAGLKEKIRPRKQLSQTYETQTSQLLHHTNQHRSFTEPKSHANKAPKPHGHYNTARTLGKADALTDAHDHTTSAISKSLLELLPNHTNNTESAIHTALRESAAAMDAEILYSFDNKGPSPGQRGRKVDLGGLVEIAEQKWANEQTERIVKGEYEVLDNEGQTTVLGKSKGKKSPKQKAVKNIPAVAKNEIEEDDGFELI